MKMSTVALALCAASLSCGITHAQSSSTDSDRGNQAQNAKAFNLDTRGISAENDGSFNYQGRLEFNGEPANGTYYFEVHLLDTNGNEIDPRFDLIGPVQVADGLFEMDIQMGGTSSDARFYWQQYGHLAKKMRIGVGTVEGSYTTLSPDVDLGSSPQSLWAMWASGLQFPYFDVFFDPGGDANPMLTLQSQFGGSVLQTKVYQDENPAIIYVESASPNFTDWRSSTGGVQVNVQSREVGVFSIANNYPIVGFLTSLTPSSIGRAAVLGQIDPGVPNAVAFLGINGDSSTSVELAGPDFGAFIEGDLLLNDNLEVNGEALKFYNGGGFAPMAPLAYGFINFNGTVSSGSGNFTCTWNASSMRYEITISGESYFFSQYATTVTPASGTIARMATTSSVSGNLIVYMLDPLNAGNRTQTSFQFVVYDPTPNTTVINRNTTTMDDSDFYQLHGLTPEVIELHPLRQERQRTSTGGIQVDN